MTRAVFFDVDFTLIYPGPTFQGEGYRQFGEKHGLSLDPGAFHGAVVRASFLLDGLKDHAYDAQLFVDYTRLIIEEMGGRGPGVSDCAREIYREWAACQHFSLYEDVDPVLRELSARGIRLGLISNTHRCLESFQAHFELQDVISVAVSSFEHGYMKPHPSIFESALEQAGVPPGQTVMVGDSLKQDIEGALAVGMRAVLLRRSGGAVAASVEAATGQVPGVPVIRSLHELPGLL